MSAPLRGRSVVLTRRAEDMPTLRARLAALGASVTEVPSIRTVPLPLPAGALDGLEQAAWLVFASAAGVRCFVEAWRAAGAPALGQARLAAVGPATAALLTECLAPVRPVAVAQPHQAEGLAALLLQQATPRAGPLWLLGARDGRQHVQEVLRARGFEVRCLALYETRPYAAADAAALRLAPGVHTILFTSPSCVQGFLARTAMPTGARLCSMGPSTSAALRAAGYAVDAEATPHSLDGLVTALTNLWAAVAAPDEPRKGVVMPAVSLSMPSRPRRLRRSGLVRALAAETRLSAAQLMTPHFVLSGEGRNRPIAAMPGIAQLSVDLLLRQVEADLALGLDKVLLFGIPDAADKDPHGSAAARPEGPVGRAVAALRKQFGDAVLVATDVCLCAYTTHGHCGVLGPGGEVDNDASLPHLSAMALAHAAAGADVVAPSDMMDGRVGTLRHDLDAAGHTQALILAYSAKYASAYYGPFREAAGSSPGKGDRKGYQMDPRNAREALREVRLDEAQGADMVLVKPALAYLDVIARVRAHTELPIACYNVSGEYSMVKAAAARGFIDEAAVVRENLLAMARAGADVLITYHGREALRGNWLQGG